ncbi:MAG: cytochrome c [Bacteroidota bacterium]
MKRLPCLYSAACWLPLFLCVVLSSCNAPAAAPHSQAVQQDAAASLPEQFGFGREVTAEEIAQWDIDVMPDGTGLPVGAGTVAGGAILYQQQCAACHGTTGVEGPNDRLVGRLPDDVFTMHEDLGARRHKAVGSYWPYSTTLFDYIRRAMPHPAPGSLADEDVYALTAYILHLNGLVDADAVMDAVSLPAVAMPAQPLFVPDDRLQHDQVH